MPLHSAELWQSGKEPKSGIGEVPALFPSMHPCAFMAGSPTTPLYEPVPTVTRSVKLQYHCRVEGTAEPSDGQLFQGRFWASSGRIVGAPMPFPAAGPVI